MLDFEYGINTGNRFLQFVDHDEEPEAFIAAHTKPEPPVQKKTSTKDSKASTKKTTGKPATTTTANTTKTNKENLTSKPTGGDQRKQNTTSSTAVFSDNNQQVRGDSARGSRGGSKRGTGGQFDGTSRGRSQRFNKFEGQQNTSSTNESNSFDQSGEGWSNEGGSRGTRGRGGPRRGNFDGSRGTGTRGRGRGGRPQTGNRSFEEGGHDNAELDVNRTQSGREYEPDVSPQERTFEPDSGRRSHRGNFRSRPYTGNRDGELSQEDHRVNRRLNDRQPRSFVSGVKAIEKKDGEGAHNWGNPTENPEDHPISEEITEATGQAAQTKDWAQQMDEAEKQITLDEYKKQIEAKKRANQEKLPQFNTRSAGEGEDPKHWQKPAQVYRKKNADGSDDEDDEEGEEGSGEEENESEEEYEEEQFVGKKKIITIPLRFKPIDSGRGSSRGGPRRPAGSARYRENAPSDSPSQESPAPTGAQGADSQGNYRTGQRGGRGDQRRSFGNSNRNSRSGRSQAEVDAPSLDNPDEFPTLLKQ